MKNNKSTQLRLEERAQSPEILDILLLDLTVETRDKYESFRTALASFSLIFVAVHKLRHA